MMQNTAMLNVNDQSMPVSHKRPAHISYPGLRRLRSMATGIHFHDNNDAENCISCIKGKSCRKKFPKQSVTRAIKVKSHGGASYFMTLIDDKTRMTCNFPKSKR